MYIVKFVRKDGKPDEEYYYHTLQEAEAHIRLFADDDSELYENIQLDKDTSDYEEDNDMNINYIPCGDYRIPALKLRSTHIRIGYYGRLRKAYLQLIRPILFNEYILQDTLYEHCAEVDRAAQHRHNIMMKQLVERDGITEELKARDPMEWVRRMNACKNTVEEVIKHELIYV